ncbi:hypothetical protein D3C77_474120 [compost metagenome]
MPHQNCFDQLVSGITLGAPADATRGVIGGADLGQVFPQCRLIGHSACDTTEQVSYKLFDIEVGYPGGPKLHANINGFDVGWLDRSECFDVLNKARIELGGDHRGLELVFDVA